MAGHKQDDFAGAVHIRLGVVGGRVGTVDVRSTRPPEAARVFHGRPPGDVARMMGLVFSLCGRAQTVCALGAIEAAQDTPAPPEMLSARDALRVGEMLSQSVMRVALDWPKLLGLAPRADVARACLAAEATLERALFGGTDWRVPGGVAFAPDTAAAQSHVRDLAAVLEDAVHDNLADQLRGALTQGGLDGFGSAHESDGQVEQGALVRQWDAPAVQAARADHGVGLRARLEARLADIRALPDQILGALKSVGPDDPCPLTPQTDGTGEARVETARGPLRHRVTITGGLIADYRIDAPTEVNFAPDGVIAKGLAGAPGGDVAQLRQAAELFALAVDPCVACHLDIDGEGHG